MHITFALLALAAVAIAVGTVFAYDRELARLRRREQQLLDELDSAVRLFATPTNVRVVHVHRGGAA